MRSSIILASLLATLALANPMGKRALTTKDEVFTVWTTVTKGAAPTGLSDGRSKDRSGGRHGHRSSSPVAEPSADPAISDVAVVPSPTPDAVPSPEEAPIPSSEPDPTAAVPDSNKGVSASAPAASSPAPDMAPAANVASSYGQQILDQHNIHRANHSNTGPVTWSDQLAATALKIANTCVYEHNTDIDKSQYVSGYGQNIGAGAPPEDIPAMITNGMYNDEAPAYEGLYGQDNPDMSNFHQWGHFSQIVWRNTKQIGCATVKCGTLANAGGGIRPYFTVCNYAPPGNVGGQYTNVGTRLGKPTVSL